MIFATEMQCVFCGTDQNSFFFLVCVVYVWESVVIHGDLHVLSTSECEKAFCSSIWICPSLAPELADGFG
jgi:hypothetical protein